MSQTGAVIDLGTNTWHLLVGRFGETGKLERLFHERRYVFLYSQGKEVIGPEPYHKALEAVRHYKQKIDEIGVSLVAANGTEGLRKAKNGAHLIADIADQTGIEIQLINGTKEAQLTAKGIDIALKNASFEPPESQVVMDIGGGSVELLWREEGTQRQLGSFPVGLGVMYPRFLAGEAFTSSELLDLRRWLASYLSPFFQSFSADQRPALVGAAGTFEILAAISQPDAARPAAISLKTEDLRPLLKQLMTTSLEERSRMPGIDPERLAMMPLAAYLVDYVLDFCQQEQVIVSRYGLKEGALEELLLG
ncbi:MAG: hypothetical protein AAFN65_10565 [Bacteroidota bacterium]